jgi:hypothetical protein
VSESWLLHPASAVRARNDRDEGARVTQSGDGRAWGRHGSTTTAGGEEGIAATPLGFLLWAARIFKRRMSEGRKITTGERWSYWYKLCFANKPPNLTAPCQRIPPLHVRYTTKGDRDGTCDIFRYRRPYRFWPPSIGIVGAFYSNILTYLVIPSEVISWYHFLKFKIWLDDTIS